MQKILHFFALSAFAIMVSSCAKNDTTGKPLVREYVPRYINFTYKLDGRVQVRHSYLFGAGVQKCFYVGELAKPYMDDYQLVYPFKSEVIDDFFEQNGHIYQGGANGDKNVFGYPYTSKLGGDINPETGEQETIINKNWLFRPFCSDYVGPASYSIDLRKSSYLSVEEDIAQTKRIIGSAWKHVARWEPESLVQRGNNTWAVLKIWNRAFYLADASEYWYLPVADNTFYYAVIFSYKTSTLEHAPEQYAKAREMFNHILDSFVIRDLSPEEIATIVNPEPIEPQQSRMAKRDWLDRELYNQQLIDRLKRNTDSNLISEAKVRGAF